MLVRMALLMMLAVSGAVSADVLNVHTDGPRIFIEAEKQSLTTVFAHIAEATGAVVQVSPKVERPVSLLVSGVPIQRAMDQIASLHSLNIVLGWQRDSDGNTHLASIDVLPDGDMDYSSLAEDDAREARILNQQKHKRPGRAIPGGAEDKSWWSRQKSEAQQKGN